MSGFIKDYRSELDSDIWMMPPLYHRVWQYLKYKVNHSPNKIPMGNGSFFDIQPGQHMTSIRNISQGVGYYEGLKWREPNPKTISTILKWLEKQNMITIDRGKGNRQYTLITLLNWDLYQSVNGEGNRKVTDNGEGKKQLTDINKNDKEGSKNDKEQIPYAAIVDHLNSKTGKNYKPTARKTKELIRARWNEGYSIEDFHKVIDVCSQKWKGKTFSNGVYGDEYLRPSTLFNGKFDERLNWSLDDEKKVTMLNEWKSDSIKPDKSLFKISGGR